ncbi:hypothetical protein [Alicyclobacillus dauci]|uniref:YCII-related domain-containing protein n=1 Tax=Alicyclobacillus dauci TaxID=1475485 RepID=A0ABY6Z284_9BACL|nr:hypothetical protein [Alicyclobacillus dauci]WAH36618.1 hypothetical protein NZD86_20950 [Alicyclobacillus dauci]
MKIYIVTYELNEADTPAHHSRVIEAIQYQGEAVEIQHGVWILKSVYAHSAIRKGIEKELDPGDKLFVGSLKGYSAMGETFSKKAASLIASVWHTAKVPVTKNYLR